MGKIIFIDVDGTLLDYENKLPASADIAIKEARKNGHHVYIWNIGLDGMIGGNGSYVKDKDTVVMYQLITLEQCKHIVDWCHSRNLEFYLESNNGLFASKNFEEKGNPVIKVYGQRKGKENASEQTVRTVFSEMIYGGELYRDDCNKVSFILNSYQDHLDSIKEFPDLKPGTWGDADEIALFGDAKVDIPMLEYCNVGVAVNSGGDEIKAMADYVTDDVDKDDIYKAFVHFGLIDDILNLC